MKSVIEYLDNSAQRFPDKVAYSDDITEITFSSLSEAVNSIGSNLYSSLRARNTPIVVLVDRDVNSVIAMLGVAASGNFYVPVSIDQPSDRLQTIFEQVKPAAIVIPSKESGASAFVPESVPQFYGDELKNLPADHSILQAIRRESLDTDPLFAICTSGSTGVPKAVVKSHRSVLEFIPSFAEIFGFTSDEVFGNQAPFEFDVSTKDIYTTLYCGASAFIIPKSCFTMPKKLATALDEKNVTALVWAVSALCVVSGLKAFKHTKPAKIQKVLFSGEVMPIKHLNVWREYYPDALFVNLYGPTESTGNCMYYAVDREFETDETLPLGIHFPNSNILVLNEEHKPIQPGEIGEIYIRGTSLALGYYRDPKRTAEAFVQNPLNSCYPEIVYRTGDLATLDETGEYRFAARRDFQIKHMGHRIELEELEMHINGIDGIGRSCCVYNAASKKIICYYEGALTAKEIIGELNAKLPKYMIPNRFESLDALPTTPNGKLDRRKMQALAGA